jgi:hypothetical protein
MECTEPFDVIFEKFERKVKIAGSEYVWDHLNRPECPSLPYAMDFGYDPGMTYHTVNCGL